LTDKYIKSLVTETGGSTLLIRKLVIGPISVGLSQHTFLPLDPPSYYLPV